MEFCRDVGIFHCFHQDNWLFMCERVITFYLRGSSRGVVRAEISSGGENIGRLTPDS